MVDSDFDHDSVARQLLSQPGHQEKSEDFWYQFGKQIPLLSKIHFCSPRLQIL